MLFATVCVAVALLTLQEPAAPPPALPPIAADTPAFLEAEIQLANQAPQVFSFGYQGTRGLRTFALSNEGRDQVAMVIGGFGRCAGPPGKSGLSLLFFLHIHRDGKLLLEAQLLNDAMVDPPGLLAVRYRISHLGKVVAEGDRAFPDQTGVCVFAGDGRFAPRPDLLRKYTENLVEPRGLRRIDTTDAEPVADPDPTHVTSGAASHRNRYHAVQAMKYLATNDARYLERLLDFVATQSLRPYHLSEASGEPFFAARYPRAHFIEGRPELRPGRETFGRDALSAEQRGGAERNGWDQGHMNVEELYAAYMLTGSRVARRELVLIAEQLLTTPYVANEGYFQHSARAFGWVARMFVRAYQASGEPRYLDAVRRMMRSVQKHRVTEPFPALVRQKPQDDHIKDEHWESPFMVAVAASALALYCREVPDDKDALELLRFCGDLLVDRAWSEEGQGFYFDYSVDSARRSGTPKTDGVVLWIPGALVDVASLLPEGERAKYLGPARSVYQTNQQTGYATARHVEFFRWFLNVARAFPEVGIQPRAE